MESETVRKELEVQKVIGIMREKRIRWFGHVWRGEEQGLCKRVMGLKVGRRSRWKPKRRFMDCAEENPKSKWLGCLMQKIGSYEGEKFTLATLINQKTVEGENK